MTSLHPNTNFMLIDLTIQDGHLQDKTVLACVAGSKNETLVGCLHPDEKERLSSLKIEKSKVQYLNGRFAAKLSSSLFLNERDLTKIKVVSTKYNRPFTQFPAYEVPDLGISHTGFLAVAVSFPRSHHLSIDIETLNPGLADATDFIINNSEKSLLTQFTELNPGFIETIVWSAKEAIAKLCGLGFTVPLSLYEVKSVRVTADKEWSFEFKNFSNYKVTAFSGEKLVLSMAHSTSSELQFSHTKGPQLINILENWEVD